MLPSQVAALTSHRRWAIRRLFLIMKPGRKYSLTEVSRVTGWSRKELLAAIGRKEIAATESKGIYRIAWEEIVSLALQQWSIPVIEEELGDTAAQALPPLVRTRKWVAVLPAYQVEMLHRLAHARGISVDALLANYLLDLASTIEEEMEPHLPGFGAAMRFPHE